MPDISALLRRIQFPVIAPTVFLLRIVNLLNSGPISILRSRVRIIARQGLSSRCTKTTPLQPPISLNPEVNIEID